jgi:hypothetical protein
MHGVERRYQEVCASMVPDSCFIACSSDRLQARKQNRGAGAVQHVCQHHMWRMTSRGT